jgi:hypothetical protein
MQARPEIRWTVRDYRKDRPHGIQASTPQELSNVHNVPHVSNLKKCLFEEDVVIPIEEVCFNDKLQFVEQPLEIVNLEIKMLKRSRIAIVKVRWESRHGAEFTWELVDQF